MMQGLSSSTALLMMLAAIGLLGTTGCHDIHLDYDVHKGEIALFDDLYSISVIDQDHAVAVGYYGAAYYTSDGGDSWNAGDTGTRASLYKVSMADTEKGWAVGQRGLVLRTVDGGKTWQRQPNLKESEGTHLFSVAAVDQDTAWAVGEWGTRLHTTDGGSTWTDHSFTVDTVHPMFQWLSPLDQDKVRAGGVVYDDVNLNDVACLGPPSKRCWLIGEFGYIFYSDDGGETWVQSMIEGSREMPPIDLGHNEIEFDDDVADDLRKFAMDIAGDGHLNVAIEGVVTKREIAEFGDPEDPFELFEIIEARAQEVRMTLEDAGLPSERVRMRNQPPWDYEDFLDDDPEFLSRYLDGRTSDVPGTRVRVIQNPILFSVRFRDESNGLIAGLGGVVMRSADGGRSWAYSKIDRKMAVFSVASVPGRALAIGEKGLVRASLDDGASWGMTPDGSFPTIFTFMRDIDFERAGQVGFIVGQTGRILKTIDAGFAWRQVLPPPDEEAS
jgi:photosystem II stability/assembly factor-like uncharacterized protein